MKEIKIRSLEIPDFTEPRALLKWFCTVFDLSDQKKGSEPSIEEQILINLIYATRQNRGISSSELKTKPSLPKSTMIYNLNKFIDSGLVIKKGHRYYLRATNMAKTIEEIGYDIDRELMKITDAAKEFDKLIESTLSDTKALKK